MANVIKSIAQLTKIIDLLDIDWNINIDKNDFEIKLKNTLEWKHRPSVVGPPYWQLEWVSTPVPLRGGYRHSPGSPLGEALLGQVRKAVSLDRGTATEGWPLSFCLWYFFSYLVWLVIKQCHSWSAGELLSQCCSVFWKGALKFRTRQCDLAFSHPI